MSRSFVALAALEGVALRYTDPTGTDRHVPDQTVTAILKALGHDPGPDDSFDTAHREELARREKHCLPPYVVVAETSAPRFPKIDARWTLALEGGKTARGAGAQLPELPIGRHRLEVGDEVCWVLAAPPQLPLPRKGWGISLPLYGLRSADRGGLGDYADLAVAARALAQLGADFVGINPIHAGFSTRPDMISPYSPSHRRRHSVMHLFAQAERSNGFGALLDYKAALASRREALEDEFRQFVDDGTFASFQKREGDALERFALYEALAEVHGPTWDGWPPEFRDLNSAGVRTFARQNRERVRFHAWLQFRADAQIAEAANAAQSGNMRQGLYLDLAVGTHPHGAETWADPRAFAFGVSLGAPPDAFSEGGQTWNVAPLNPRTLVQDGFAALAGTLRTQMRHAGMIRIDHILGFDRAFWVPECGLPGSYVTMPRDAMLAIARIEAMRAGAVIVGEDLGNVPKGLREDLSDSGILGCRVAMFEDAPPASDYPEAVLTSFGTHDLPTWIGWRQGRDIEARYEIGEIDATTRRTALAQRGAEVARLQDRIGGSSHDALHAYLGATPSRLVALQIEDILGVEDQSNLPGTVDTYPNWRRRLPVDVGDLAKDHRVQKAAALMRAAARANDLE